MFERTSLLSTIPWILVICYGLYAVGLLQHATTLLAYPWSVDYVEMPEIGRAWDISRGIPIYTSWEQLPLHEANYTPLYSITNAPLVALTGPTPFTGRLLSLLFTLGTATIIFQILRERNVLTPIAIVSAFLYLSSHMVWAWSSLVRVDSMAVFCNVFALWCCQQHWIQKKDIRWLYASVIVCVLAAFTRQTMVAAAIAVFCASGLRNIKITIRLFALYAGLGLIGCVILLLSTDFLAWNHLVLANINEYNFPLLRLYLGQVWELYHWLLPVVCIGLWKARQHPLILVYALMGALVSLTSGKIGSSFNYLLELWIGLCLLTGLSFPTQKEKSFQAIPLVLILLVGWQQIFHYPWQRFPKKEGGMKGITTETWNSIARMQSSLPLYWLDPIGKNPLDSLRRNTKYYVADPAPWEADIMMVLEDKLRTVSGPILSEDMNFTLSLGKEISIQPFEFTQMARQRDWDPKPWYDCLATQCFGALVLKFPLGSDLSQSVSGWHFTPISLQLMEKHYQLAYQAGAYWLYLPKGKESGDTP